MGPPGHLPPRKKTKNPSGPGLVLLRKRAEAHYAHSQNIEVREKDVLESVIDVKNLDDVIEEAERAGRVFSTSNPLPELLLNAETGEGIAALSLQERLEQQKLEEELHQESLTVPRRPQWHAGQTPDELDIQERKEFLSWRRGLARLEENEKLVLTPFEKNLDIWRQLWRVLERSDMVVMVVDARNPLFYRCTDLEAYVKEIDPKKKTLMLLNKADLLDPFLREQWATYLTSQGISFLFWSAKAATAVMEGKGQLSTTLPSVPFILEAHHPNSIKILGREELLSRLQEEAESIAVLRNMTLQASHDLSRVVIGFVGYPNVGKSSTINALVGQKKTGVTSTPGKTKHFQTLIISDKLMLCDCPGLVFPSFTSSRAEMVASGVLPIDKLTDYRGPVQVVANQVSKATLEAIYGIMLPKPKPYEPQNRPPFADELLHVFARSRGYFANSGLPDETRAARQILKDFLSGKLPYCYLPPKEQVAVYDTAQQGSASSAHHEEDSRDSESDTTGDYDDLFVDTRAVNQETTKETTSDSGFQLLGVVSSSQSNMAQIFHDLDDSVDSDLKTLGASGRQSKSGASHKMHKKLARKKDRSWRVGNDKVQVPVVRGVKIPVSYGAAQRSETTV